MPVPENVVVMMASGSVPTGWSSSTIHDMNGRFAKGKTTGTPGGTGGSSTHTHSGGSHTHSETGHGHGNVQLGGGPQTAYAGPSYGSGYPRAGHYHNDTPLNSSSATSGSASDSWNSGSNEPPYYNFMYIKSDGTPEGLPPNCIVFYNSNSIPAGWTRHTASGGKYVRGSSSGGGTGGGALGHSHSVGGAHTHTAGNHTHATNGQTNSNQGANSGDGEKGGNAQTQHIHQSLSLNSGGAHTSGSTNSGGSSSSTPDPYYIKVTPITNNSGSDNDTIGAICMWQGTLGSIPDAYTLCDGNNGTPPMNDRFLKMASGSDNGATGGNTSHSHSGPGTHTHSSSAHTHSGAHGTNTGQCVDMGYGQGTPCGNHAHSVPTSSSATITFGNSSGPSAGGVDHQPAYRYICYIQQTQLINESFVPTVTMF